MAGCAIISPPQRLEWSFFIRPCTVSPSRPEFRVAPARRRSQDWPPGHRRRRRAAVLTATRTAPCCSRSRAAHHHHSTQLLDVSGRGVDSSVWFRPLAVDKRFRCWRETGSSVKMRSLLGWTLRCPCLAASTPPRSTHGLRLGESPCAVEDFTSWEKESHRVVPPVRDRQTIWGAAVAPAKLDCHGTIWALFRRDAVH